MIFANERALIGAGLRPIHALSALGFAFLKKGVDAESAVIELADHLFKFVVHMDHDSSDLRTDVAISPSVVAAATPLIFLADGFFSEAVEFFIGLAQVGLVRDAEDDDRIAAILAVEGSPSA